MCLGPPQWRPSLFIEAVEIDLATVRFGSLAAMKASPHDVRFTLESGHRRRLEQSAISNGEYDDHG
jgi:hypothetical protein